MMITRSTAVTASIAAAAALAAMGITYASAASQPEQPATVVQQAAAAQAPFGGDSGKANASKGDEGKGDEGWGDEGREHHKGRIQINERSFSSHPGDCITVVSGLGARTLNIRNETRSTVEVFRGAVCDNGAPIAVVGPHSQSDGVNPGHRHDKEGKEGKEGKEDKEGVEVENGVVGSFRVIERHEGKDWS
ncbi:hypothetical protein [Streptomyces sp. NPDC097981]|uniref:hypothetical protein n=1 Tax=Streptomyces sp. NPDC097981 TaxID=3155428 RepID=UPI00333325B9